MFLENMPSIHHATFRPLFPQNIDRKSFSKKLANLPRCNFKVIPPPCKAASEGRVYQLYGDIVLMERGGMLSFETSLLNKFKTFKEVQITKLHNNQKLATIFPESKKAFEPYDWILLIERLRQMGNLDSLEWAEIINDFCSKSKVAIELCSSGKELLGDKEKEIFKQVTVNSREKKASLLEAHPCLLVKTSLKKTGFGLSEISFNEKFLSEIGYSMDTFSSSVLQEGISQLMPHDDKISSDIMKAFMKNCFEINSNLSQVLEFNSVVFMKCGYMKNVKLQVHFLPIYENGFFELDRVLVVTSKGIPYFDENRVPPLVINREFWEIMAAKERDLSTFLNRYYDKSPSMRYTHLNRVCRIKELTKNKKKLSLKNSCSSEPNLSPSYFQAKLV